MKGCENQLSEQENKNLHKVVETMQKAFDRVEKVYRKVLVFGDKFKNRYHCTDF